MFKKFYVHQVLGSTILNDLFFLFNKQQFDFLSTYYLFELIFLKTNVFLSEVKELLLTTIKYILINVQNKNLMYVIYSKLKLSNF